MRSTLSRGAISMMTSTPISDGAVACSSAMRSEIHRSLMLARAATQTVLNRTTWAVAPVRGLPDRQQAASSQTSLPLVRNPTPACMAVFQASTTMRCSSAVGHRSAFTILCSRDSVTALFCETIARSGMQVSTVCRFGTQVCSPVAG